MREEERERRKRRVRKRRREEVKDVLLRKAVPFGLRVLLAVLVVAFVVV